MSEKQPNGEKSPEELYLEELYKAMDTGEVPSGMVPPQIPSLQNSDYQFHKINLITARRNTPIMRILITGKVLTALYLGVGILVFFSVLRDENLSFNEMLSTSVFSQDAAEMFILLSWVFYIGIVIAAASSVLTLVLRVKQHPIRKIWPFAAFAASVVFAVIVSGAI